MKVSDTKDVVNNSGKTILSLGEERLIKIFALFWGLVL